MFALDHKYNMKQDNIHTTQQNIQTTFALNHEYGQVQFRQQIWCDEGGVAQLESQPGSSRQQEEDSGEELGVDHEH
jgi:hypothetical protein